MTLPPDPATPRSAKPSTGASPGRGGGERLRRGLLRHLGRSRLIEPGQRVLVALSGGLDSTVLLHLLRFAAPGLELVVHAAHFDHAMRSGSEGDARWVAGLCTAWRIPLHHVRASRPPRNEEEARALRYSFLLSAAEAMGASRIATAHHADDQAETVLFRAVRGTGLRGLAGIPPRRGSLVRPLLPFRRDELQTYAHEVGLAWREDPTNVTLPAGRNRIRREVLPLLEEISPGAGTALARLAGLARSEEAAWSSLLDRVAEALIVGQDGGTIDLDRGGMRSYHPGVRARLLRRAFRVLGVHPSAAATRAALELVETGRSGSWVDIGGGVRVGREFDRIRIRRGGRASGPPETVLIAAPTDGHAELCLAGKEWRARWRMLPAAADESGESGAYPGEKRFDAAALSFPLRLRGWSPGDRVRLREGTKKLKKVFLERRVPASERRELPVLSDAAGHVLWVPGVVRSVDARPRSGEPALGIRVLDGERD